MQRRQPKVTVLVPFFFGLIITIALGIFLLVSVRTANRTTREQLTASNRAMVSVSAKLMSGSLYESDNQMLNNMLQEFIRDPDILYASVRDQDGQVVTDARVQGWLPQGQKNKDLARQAFAQNTILDRKFENTLVVSGPIANGPNKIGTLELVFDLSPVQASINSMTRTIIFSGIATLSGVVLLSVIFTRYATGHLRKLVNAANEIGRGNLEAEVPILRLEETAIIGTALSSLKNNLRELYDDFDQQMKNVERRASYLEAIATMASDSTSILDLRELLSRVSTQIGALFDYYRQGIYLLDGTGKWAILQAGHGERMDKALERGLQLEVGIEGIVGHVARTGEPYVAQDVEKDPLFIPDGEDSKTRSEIALPLIARGEIVGVLDVESKEPEAFSDEDAGILQTLADQLAVAINNAKLFQQAQENFDTLQRAFGELSRESWSEFLRGQLSIGYYCDESGVTSLDQTPVTNIDPDGLPEVTFPVTMRGGQVIGHIKAHKTNSEAEWSPGEINMMKSLTEQMSLALESAQLYQDTQRSATREQLAREITDKMRRASTVNDIIQTAIDELYLALGASQQVFARLEIEDVPSQKIG